MGPGERHVVNLGGLEGGDRVSGRQRAEVPGQRSQAGTLGPAGYVSVSSSPQTRVWHLGQLRSCSNHFLPLWLPSQSWGTRRTEGKGVSSSVPIVSLPRNCLNLTPFPFRPEFAGEVGLGEQVLRFLMVVRSLRSQQELCPAGVGER